jgi:type I restriction enzyme S subunit
MKLDNQYSSCQYSEYFQTEIPSHWSEKRLGYLAEQDRTAFVDGPFGSDLKTTDYKDSGVPLIQLNNIRDSKHLLQNMKFVTNEKKEQLIRHIALPMDIVIAKMAEPVARAAVVSDFYSEYIIVADCVKMTPDLSLTELNYLVWAINCDIVRTNAELVSTGTTRIRVNLSELKKLKVPYPPIEEQAQIAAFLDHETAKIDNLIDKQQQLIELLKEKRQAVISHAVTKGLNPDVPMKDSGVEWLGEVPEHWEVCPLKYHANFIDGDRGSEYPNDKDLMDDGIVFLSSKNITAGEIDLGDANYISQQKFDRLSRGKAINGDVIVKVRGSTGRIGELAIFESEKTKHRTAFINAQMMIIRLRISLDNFFVRNIAQGHYWMEQLNIGAYGTAQQQLNNSIFSNMILAVPSLNEQLKINEYLAVEKSCFDELIKNALAAIELLQERRTALISAAVTGKIDVRNWVAPTNDTEVNQEPQEATA